RQVLRGASCENGLQGAYQLGVFFAALRCDANMVLVHANLVGAVADVKLVVGQKNCLQLGGCHAAFDFKQNKICAGGIDVDAADRFQGIVQPANVADEALSAFVVISVRGGKQRKKILRKGVHVPSRNILAHVIQDV